MAFQVCLAFKEQSIAFLRFLPSLYYCQKLSIPWKSIGSLRNLSTQYILNIHTDFLRSSQCHHYHSNHSKFENLKTEFEQVHHRAVQDTNALCRLSNRFYFLKLLAKITALLITIGFFNLAFYFLNPFPNSSAPGRNVLEISSISIFSLLTTLILFQFHFPFCSEAVNGHCLKKLIYPLMMSLVWVCSFHFFFLGSSTHVCIMSSCTRCLKSNWFILIYI